MRRGDAAEDGAQPRLGEFGGDRFRADRHVQVRMAAAEEGRDPRPVAALGDQRKDELWRVVPVEADDDQRHGAVGAADMAIPVGTPFEPLIGGGGRAGLLQPTPQRLGGGEVVEHLRSREDGRRWRAIGGEPVRCGQNGEVHARDRVAFQMVNARRARASQIKINRWCAMGGSRAMAASSPRTKTSVENSSVAGTGRPHDRL